MSAPSDEHQLKEAIERRRCELGIVERAPAPKPWERAVEVPVVSPEEQAERNRRHQEYLAHEAENARKAAWRAFCEERGSRYGECRLGTYECQSDEQRSVLADLERYGDEMRVHLMHSEGVVLYGPPGTGKDHLVAGLAYRAIMQHGLTVRWKSGMQIFSEIRDRMETSESEYAYIHGFKRPDVLILSDPLPPIGALTQFQSVKLYEILSARYDNGKVTWVTINVASGSEASERLGSSVYDRMRHGSLARFCNWPSYRKAK
jgi:DNA replication protein DnaC